MADVNPNAHLNLVSSSSDDERVPANGGFTSIYLEATRLPQDKLDDLKSWWKAALPEERYRMYKVQVLRRENEGTETMKLVFNLVGPNADEMAQELYVYPYIESNMVWPELPSTAQLAKNGQFAYLLLSPSFMKDRAKAPKEPDHYAEPGGKWPIGAAALMESAVDPNTKALRALTELIQALASPGRER